MHDTFQLLKVGTRDRHISKTFLGVYAGDRVPKRQQMPCCYIINTDNSGEPGKHWIAIFEKSFTDLGQNIFFYSYGSVPSQLNPLWKNFDSYKRSNNDYQQKHSRVSGDDCLYVLKLLNAGKTLENVLIRFDPHDKECNDARVSERIHAEHPRILNTSTSHIVIAEVVKAGKYTIKKHVPLKTVSFFVSTAMNPHPQGQLGVSANTEDLNRGDLRLQVTCRDYSKLVMTWNCFKNLT